MQALAGKGLLVTTAWSGLWRGEKGHAYTVALYCWVLLYHGEWGLRFAHKHNP